MEKRMILRNEADETLVECGFEDDLQVEIDHRIDPWDEASTTIQYLEKNRHNDGWSEYRNTETVEERIERLEDEATHQRFIDHMTATF